MRDRITFFNTYEEVIPFFEAVLPRLAAKGLAARAVLSKGIYRQTPWLEDPETRRRYLRHSWVPGPLLNKKRWCGLWYWALGPLHVLFNRSDLHAFLTEPPLFYVAGYWLSRLRRIPCVIYLMDLHIDGAAALGVIRRRSLLHRVLSGFSDAALRRADRVIVLGRCMQARLLAKGVPSEHVRVIHLWPARDVAPVPREANMFLKTHALEGKFLVMYSGNMGLYHEMRTILEVAAGLRDLPDLLFVFLGGGGRRREVEAAAAAGGSNIRLFGFQERGFLSHSLSAADAHFISLRSGCEGFLVPSKFYGAIACGRPVIYEGSGEGEVARTIRELGCGQVVAHRDAAALRKAVLAYYHDREAARRAGELGLSASRARFTEERGIERFVGILEELIGGSPPAAT